MFRSTETSGQLQRREDYAVDNSCDFARALVVGIHRPRWRWPDSPTLSNRADRVHHQHCFGPANCLAQSSLPRNSTLMFDV